MALFVFNVYFSASVTVIFFKSGNWYEVTSATYWLCNFGQTILCKPQFPFCKIIVLSAEGCCQVLSEIMYGKFLAFFLAHNKLLFLVIVIWHSPPTQDKKSTLFNKTLRLSTEFYFSFTFTKVLKYYLWSNNAWLSLGILFPLFVFYINIW